MSRAAEPRLAILGYHKIGAPTTSDWSTWYYVPEATFEAHLRCLRNAGWEVLDARTFVDALDRPGALPERAALLTFDDGYRSMREVALPVLERFAAPAVLFVPTEFIGDTNRFDADEEPEEPICDWSDLRELERRGVSIQSHGVSHRRFSELEPSEQRRELAHSRATLEGSLGTRVDLFAFPYGDDGCDPAPVARLLGECGYRAACLYGGGVLRPRVANRFRLERLAIGPDTDLERSLDR